jgi:hypothetical protein
MVWEMTEMFTLGCRPVMYCDVEYVEFNAVTIIAGTGAIATPWLVRGGIKND